MKSYSGLRIRNQTAWRCRVIAWDESGQGGEAREGCCGVRGIGDMETAPEGTLLYLQS